MLPLRTTCLALAAFAGTATAAYPDRPITMIVAYVPGGRVVGFGVLARLVRAPFSEGHPGQQFMRRAGKPLVMIKVGKSPTGRDAVSSHTGLLSSDDAGYQAAFDRHGVIRAQTLEDLNNYARVLSLRGVMRVQRAGQVQAHQQGEVEMALGRERLRVAGAWAA